MKTTAKKCKSHERNLINIKATNKLPSLNNFVLIFQNHANSLGYFENHVNNNIGADSISQTPIELIHFAHSLDQNLTDTICTYLMYQKIYKKNFNIPVFFHRINVRKRIKIIPHLCERKIVKQW